MMTNAETLRAQIATLSLAMRNFDPISVKSGLADFMALDAKVHLCHPFGDMEGPEMLYEVAYAPLFTALPDLERRDWIISTGMDADGADWIGCAGHYMGTFLSPFLDIPPTGHLAHMRFHEFYRVAAVSYTHLTLPTKA